MSRLTADHIAFIEHWKNLRRTGEIAPTSERFLDNPDPQFSPNILILVVFPDDIVIRLQATEIVERWGMDLTGQSLFKVPLTMHKADMMTNVSRLLEHPCGLVSANSVVTSSGRKRVVETTGLPLGVPNGKPRRLVNYSWLMEPLDSGEHSETVTSYEVQQWADIGADVPDALPLRPMTHRAD
jgi:hypothetical protein